MEKYSPNYMQIFMNTSIFLEYSAKIVYGENYRWHYIKLIASLCGPEILT